MINRKGFTLIEQLVYISLIIIIMSIFGVLEQEIVRSSNALIKTNEVRQAGRLVLNKISQEIKTANHWQLLTSGHLILEHQANQEEFYWQESENAIYLNAERLSSEKINITNLTFTAFGPAGIKINLTLAGNGNNSATTLNLSTTAIARPTLYHY